MNTRLSTKKRLAKHLGKVLSYLKKREVGDLRDKLWERRLHALY